MKKSVRSKKYLVNRQLEKIEILDNDSKDHWGTIKSLMNVLCRHLKSTTIIKMLDRLTGGKEKNIKIFTNNF